MSCAGPVLGISAHPLSVSHLRRMFYQTAEVLPMRERAVSAASAASSLVRVPILACLLQYEGERAHRVQSVRLEAA